MKGFSIIVCCYNSADVIEKTLQHVAALQIPSGYQSEVILVNNLSTDNTVQLASETWNGLGALTNLRIVNEDQLGLSYARNKGIKVARFDYLVFCDDDNRLHPDYLLIASSLLDNHAEVGALGGLGIPDRESLPDYWMEDFYIYGTGPQAECNGETAYVHGAGVIIRKAAFQKLEHAGFKFLLTDRKGDQLCSGGDYELCYAITLAGYKIWYKKELTFQHFISQDRLTKEYCRRFIRESAPSIDVLDVYRYYLTHENGLRPGFYFHQLKAITYHLYKFYTSFRTRSRFKHDPKIVFLENFHIQFHKTRIKCIGRHFFRYKKWAREVEALKSRLEPVLRIPATPLKMKE